jgi:hypothetical protein
MIVRALHQKSPGLSFASVGNWGNLFGALGTGHGRETADKRWWNRIRSSAAAILLMVPALSCCAQITNVPSSDLPAVGDPSSADGSYFSAASAELPPSWSGDLQTRSQWTGGWWGARDAFADSGLTFYCDLTQYYQGEVSSKMGMKARCSQVKRDVG